MTQPLWCAAGCFLGEPRVQSGSPQGVQSGSHLDFSVHSGAHGPPNSQEDVREQMCPLYGGVTGRSTLEIKPQASERAESKEK